MSDLTDANILVTGANGFIGSHLVERLARAGSRVRALCMYNEAGSLGWLDRLAADDRERLDVVLGDVRDPGVVSAAVRDVDVVFHLAALVSIPYSYRAPASFVQTNVLGMLNVLEACRTHGVTRLVQTSTSEVYGSPQTVPIREDHPLRAQSPYSASKIAADKLCESYVLSFGLRTVTLRPFNTYGPRQSMRAVIPTILGQMLSGATEIRLGNLEPRRDFTYVLDTVEGFVAIASAELEPGTTVQLGTGSSISIGELFELCKTVTGSSARPRVEDHRVRPDASEVDHLLSDPSRARDLLGWEPSVPLEDGLRRTAEWMEGTRRLVDRPAEYHW